MKKLELKNKHLKRISLKKIMGGVLFVGITSTIVLTSGILATDPLINAAGSSAVQPLMSAFSNRYPNADLVTQAGGSGAGIRAIIDGTKEIGMASKNPGIMKVGEHGTGVPSEDEIKWIERKIKTVTIAWDGMGLVYKPDKPNTSINVDSDNILTIYKAFAGNEQKTFEDLGVIGNKTLISPYARSGGAKVSGTADAFYKDSKLKYKDRPEYNDALKEEFEAALIEGNYGPNTKTTSESNSQAWSFVKNENKVGSMVYLSAGFINNNMQEIKDNGFEVATYGDGEKFAIDKGQITTGYNWYRPLNLMISIEGYNSETGLIKDHHSQTLINWILSDETAKKIANIEGYISLTDQQILDEMTLDGTKSTFWSATDAQIFNEKNKPKVNNG